MRVPVLLDTDIGSDIDDAVCLAYLLKQPRCELLGVTTVSGRPQERAAIADAVCRAAGRTDVPIHSGVAQGLNMGIVQPECPQASILPRFSHRPPQEFRTNTAVQFLHDQISRRPGEITLLAIGPMTNLSILFSMDPEIPRKLKRLVLMCGVFSSTVGVTHEWNALCDPIATSIVYRAPVAEHVSIGLDVTTKCQMPAEECVKRFKEIGGPLGVVSAATEVWAKQVSKVTFHDPLAAAVIFRPEICKYSAENIQIETQSTIVAGLTRPQSKPEQRPHRIAVSVDPEMFFNEYFSIVSAK